jgi:hypothetical protein
MTFFFPLSRSLASFADIHTCMSIRRQQQQEQEQQRAKLKREKEEKEEGGENRK